MDAQDPRCVKTTFTGSIKPCAKLEKPEECESLGKKVLFDTHPSMKGWPEDHHFVVHAFVIDSLWMIANFGGGILIALWIFRKRIVSLYREWQDWRHRPEAVASKDGE